MPTGNAAASPYPSPLFRAGAFPILTQSAYHVETAENIVRIAEYFTTEPSPHDEEGQNYGQQLGPGSQACSYNFGITP